MCRKEIISKCVGLATILLVACLIIFLQPRTFVTSVTPPADTENQLTIQQGLDSAISFGVVHDDSQFVTAFLLAAALLLVSFPVQEVLKVYSAGTTILLRNFYCIVPKGP